MDCPVYSSHTNTKGQTQHGKLLFHSPNSYLQKAGHKRQEQLHPQYPNRFQQKQSRTKKPHPKTLNSTQTIKIPDILKNEPQQRPKFPAKKKLTRPKIVQARNSADAIKPYRNSKKKKRPSFQIPGGDTSRTSGTKNGAKRKRKVCILLPDMEIERRYITYLSISADHEWGRLLLGEEVGLGIQRED